MNWRKFSASSEETEAQATPARARPGSATRARCTTPPPIDRPKSAIRSSSTGTSSVARSALTALTTSLV